MKKYFNLVSISVFLIIITILIFTISALLIATDKTESITITSGKVSYTISGKIKEGLIVPGENIIDEPIAIINNSTVKHTLKLSVEMKLAGETIMIDRSDGYIIEENLTFDFVVDNNNHYHYQEIDFVIDESITIINVITNLVLDGYKVQNGYSGELFTISIKLYVRQADNVSWEDLGSIDFKSGLSK